MMHSITGARKIITDLCFSDRFICYILIYSTLSSLNTLMNRGDS